jgi:hypothetical protein
MPNISKEVRLQRQGFPKNVLAVLWIFNDLPYMQIHFSLSPNFCGSRRPSSRLKGGGRAIEVAFGSSITVTLAWILNFATNMRQDSGTFRAGGRVGSAEIETLCGGSRNFRHLSGPIELRLRFNLNVLHMW